MLNIFIINYCRIKNTKFGSNDRHCSWPNFQINPLGFFKALYCNSGRGFPCCQTFFSLATHSVTHARYYFLCPLSSLHLAFCRTVSHSIFLCQEKKWTFLFRCHQEIQNKNNARKTTSYKLFRHFYEIFEQPSGIFFLFLKRGFHPFDA